MEWWKGPIAFQWSKCVCKVVVRLREAIYIIFLCLYSFLMVVLIPAECKALRQASSWLDFIFSTVLKTTRDDIWPRRDLWGKFKFVPHSSNEGAVGINILYQWGLNDYIFRSIIRDTCLDWIFLSLSACRCWGDTIPWRNFKWVSAL